MQMFLFYWKKKYIYNIGKTIIFVCIKHTVEQISIRTTKLSNLDIHSSIYFIHKQQNKPIQNNNFTDAI